MTKKPRATTILIFIAFLLMTGVVASGFLWRVVRPVLHKDHINKYAGIYKFDPLLVMAVVKVESRFRSTARSHRGAMGLMQLMPETAMDMAERLGKSLVAEDLHDPDTNIELGIFYLDFLRTEFKEDEIAMLAAYNAGPTNVREWLKGGKLKIADIAFPETQNYVVRVEKTYRTLKRFQKIKNVINPA